MVVFSLMTALAAVATTWLVATPSRQATPPVGSTDAAAAVPTSERPAAAGAGARRISWDRNTDPDLAGYVVSWGDRPGIYSQSKRVAAHETSTDLEVAPDTPTVYVAIRAVDRAGVLSGYSNEIVIGQPPKQRGKGAVTPTKTPKVAKKKAPKSAEEKAAARRKKQERKRQKALGRGAVVKP